jgi:molybdate transport system regulatory protein
MNRLPGRIVGVERCGSIALVDVDAVGHQLTATLVGTEVNEGAGATGAAGATAAADTPGWQPGAQVLLLFAETEVALAKNLSGLISMRNRLRCRLVTLERGTVLTKVTLEVDGKTIVSVITTRSARTLQLAVGDIVEALVKANEMHVVPAPAACPP